MRVREWVSEWVFFDKRCILNIDIYNPFYLRLLTIVHLTVLLRSVVYRFWLMSTYLILLKLRRNKTKFIDWFQYETIPLLLALLPLLWYGLSLLLMSCFFPELLAVVPEPAIDRINKIHFILRSIKTISLSVPSHPRLCDVRKGFSAPSGPPPLRTLRTALPPVVSRRSFGGIVRASRPGILDVLIRAVIKWSKVLLRRKNYCAGDQISSCVSHSRTLVLLRSAFSSEISSSLSRRLSRADVSSFVNWENSCNK